VTGHRPRPNLVVEARALRRLPGQAEVTESTSNDLRRLEMSGGSGNRGILSGARTSRASEDRRRIDLAAKASARGYVRGEQHLDVRDGGIRRAVPAAQESAVGRVADLIFATPAGTGPSHS
jgi:hypothetical protein